MAAIASDYLGEIPIIATVELTLTTPNNSQVGPQKFHIDWGASRELQLFISITEIDEETGPLSFLSASDSKLIFDKVSFSGRLEDDQVFSIVPRNRLVKGTGPTGTCLFVDTRRCVHYGSRGNLKDRVVLIVKYITRSSDHNNSRGRIRFDRANIDEWYQELLAGPFSPT